MKVFFTKNWIHFAALAVFLITSLAYFSPQFDGYALKQHDIEQFQGMSNEIVHYREEVGEEPLWTNSMFGGMPAVQISVLYYGNVAKNAISGFLTLFPSPVGIFLIHLLGFYVLALCLRIKPLIAIVGALTFAFSTYEIIILQAGHNTKAIAVGLAAPVLGGFIMAYRHHLKWGVLLSALFMTFQLAANHLQVTYYLGILLLFIGALFLINAIREKQLKNFGLATGGLVLGYVLAGLINFGNISLTNDYAKHTIRGKNDVTITPDGLASQIGTGGLDKEYITNWSYGKRESFTLISPYVMGSHSAPLSTTNFVELAESVDMPRNELSQAMNMPLYWGEQPIVSGPFYLGIITVFLAVLGLVFINDKIKWVYLGVSLLALMLSWGKNFMGLTDFFIDYIPGYDKFRTVTIILVLVELIFPVLAILLLQKFYQEREALKEKKKMFLSASAVFVVFLLAFKVVGSSASFSSNADLDRIERQRSMMLDQIAGMDPSVLKQQYNLDVTNPAQVNEFVEMQMEPVFLGLDGVKKVRKAMFDSSTTRSILFTVLAMGVFALFFYTATPSYLIVIAFGAFMLIDQVPVNRNYLGTDTEPNGDYKHWMPEAERAYPLSSQGPDVQIMEAELRANPSLVEVVNEGEKKGEEKANHLGYTGKDKRRVVDSYKFAALNSHTNYRVFDLNGGWGSSRASYFHKSLGGYHGAKLRNIQNVFDFHISQSNNAVLNMLNVKYFIQGDQLQMNQQAMGNAWLVQKVKSYPNANDEIRALGKQFVIENANNGVLYVNGENVKTATVYGQEKMVYVLPTGDSLNVPLSNGLQKGMTALFVSDANGQTNLIPELTFDADTANSFEKWVSIEVYDEFNPREDAVMLDSEAKKLTSKTYSGSGEIQMKSYAPNKLVYEANVEGKQLAVFSEIFYEEGWKAFVDGKEQEILKVNYLLRGLELDGGKHEITFEFDLPKYHTSSLMAYAGSFVLLGGIVLLYFMERRNRGEKTGKEE